MASHLHAHATAVPHISTHVKIILEPISSTTIYARWPDLLLLTLRRYTLDNHVLSDHVDNSTY
jgi:hypothetical protein